MFIGTPPPKPLIFKSVCNQSGTRSDLPGADHTRKEFMLPGAVFSLAGRDIIEMSQICGSQMRHFRRQSFMVVSGQQKTLLARGKQGLESLFSSTLPACLQRVLFVAGTMSGIGPAQPEAEHKARNQLAGTHRNCARLRGPDCGCYVHASFHLTDTRNSSLMQLASIYISTIHAF